MIFLTAGLFLVQVILGIWVGYLLLLTVLALFAARRTKTSSASPDLRFLILIPAHNEERLLPSLLDNLQLLDYPEDLYQVHVIADNCSDQTAQIAENGRAVVHIRQNAEQRGKGHALQWLLNQLHHSDESYDAVVILDADSLISMNFLRVMSSRLKNGEVAVQAYYTVRGEAVSFSESMRYAALSVLHYLRPQGRMVLGASAGLKGNGMVLKADLVKRHEWSSSVTEDIEYHMTLLLDGKRVTFAPDATVWGEMPNTLHHSQSQQQRWERGRLQMAKTYVPKLIKKAWFELKHKKFQQAYIYFDAVMEHVIPPFSMLFALSFFVALIALSILLLLSFGSIPQLIPYSSLLQANLLVSLSLLLGQFVYLISGLYLVRAPYHIYRVLLLAPVFVVWKLWQVLRAWLGSNKLEWVRTMRNEV